MIRSLHSAAARDLTEITAFYRESGSAALADRFLEEFERTAALLLQDPGLGTPFDLPRRMHPLRTFPYSVIYRPTDQGLRILAVRQQHRHPDFGHGRR